MLVLSESPGNGEFMPPQLYTMDTVEVRGFNTRARTVLTPTIHAWSTPVFQYMMRVPHDLAEYAIAPLDQPATLIVELQTSAYPELAELNLRRISSRTVCRPALRTGQRDPLSIIAAAIRAKLLNIRRSLELPTPINGAV
jgi:hypothetical protein